MVTRTSRAARNVTPAETDKAVEATIAPVTDIAPVVDTPAAEPAKTDKTPITLESLIAAHAAAKAAFVELPNKGDIVGLLDAAGELLAVGSVATKPDNGAMMVQVDWVTNSRTTAVSRRKMTKIGPNGWTVQN